MADDSDVGMVPGVHRALGAGDFGLHVGTLECLRGHMEGECVQREVFLPVGPDSVGEEELRRVLVKVVVVA